MKYFLLAFIYTICLFTVYGQQKVKGSISTNQLVSNNFLVVSYDEARGGSYGASFYFNFKIETDNVYYEQLSDSSGNQVKLLTPIRAINYFDRYGWELKFYETSQIANKPTNSNEIASYNRVVLIFKRKIPLL